MGSNSFKIFSFLLENGYNFNTNSNENPHPILYCSFYKNNDIRYLKELLKYKNQIDFNVKFIFYDANCLEIAIWREKEDFVEILSKYLKFNIEKFNNNKFFREIEFKFENVGDNIKKILLKNEIFKKKFNQFLFYDLSLKRKINVDIFNTKSYFMWNFLQAA
jgi:ankyrin repeat protein